MKYMVPAHLAVGVGGGSKWISPMTAMVKVGSLVNCKSGSSEYLDGINLKTTKVGDDVKLRKNGSIYQGVVENRYLDYLSDLDFDDLEDHVAKFPRKHRSNEEKRLIFEKWVAHHGRKYPTPAIKEMGFTNFKKSLAYNHEYNSHYPGSIGISYPGLDDIDSEFSCRINLKTTTEVGVHGKLRKNGSIYQGEVEKRYLEYVSDLDFDGLNDHVAKFPRKHRSNEEKRLIFEKWVAHNGKKYPTPALKEMRFAHFKKSLAWIDEYNSDVPGSGGISYPGLDEL